MSGVEAALCDHPRGHRLQLPAHLDRFDDLVEAEAARAEPSARQSYQQPIFLQRRHRESCRRARHAEQLGHPCFRQLDVQWKRAAQHQLAQLLARPLELGFV